VGCGAGATKLSSPLRRSAAGRPRLKKLFAAFPAGGPGVGLFLLRVVIAAATIMRWAGAFGSHEFHLLRVWVPAVLAIMAGAALLIGFLTPIAGAGVTLGYLATGAGHLFAADAEGDCNPVSVLYLAAIALALVLLGPGAFSLDARLFGRREIVIREGRR
jgi:uncharacterized membrane protein YphA (DoxX/SURF4 family)